MPIFPLPDSILLPGVYAPFHIFEDRYKLMLSHIEGTSSDLAVSYSPELQPGQFYPHMICGVGPLQVLQENEDGSSDIIIFGSRRIEFESFVQETPYLIGEGRYLETDREMPQKTYDNLLKDIREDLIQWFFAQYDDPTRPIALLKGMEDLEPLCNFVGYYFMSEMEKKQKLLEEDNLEARAQIIWKVIRDVKDENQPGPSDDTIIFPAGGDDPPLN